jgi:hypothetical protein
MPPSVIRSEPLRRLHAYWCGLRDGSALPDYAAFDPLTVPATLGRVMVFAVERDPLRFRYRVFATQASEVLDIELTGRYIDEMPDPVMRAQVLDRLRRGVADPRPTVIVRTVKSDKLFITYESVMLTFAGDGATVDTVLFGIHVLHQEPAWRFVEAGQDVISESFVPEV